MNTFNNNEYLLEHSRKRIKILQKEGHEVVLREGLISCGNPIYKPVNQREQKK